MTLLPTSWSRRAAVLSLTLLALFGAVMLGAELRYWSGRLVTQVKRQAKLGRVAGRLPVSILPGPPRQQPLVFRLDAAVAAAMRGQDQPDHERWCDIAGNYYSGEFIQSFSYTRAAAAADLAPTAPAVYVSWQQQGSTFSGRLEAHNLKPNFAYQLKLCGDYQRDPAGFAAIGQLGRWRLPGKATNYTDADYAAFPRKDLVEAYVLFDFIVTDAAGNAVRDFALDSSLHVLWNATRQRRHGVAAADLVPVEVVAADARRYARPKAVSQMEELWAEREHVRYRRASERLQLPPRSYAAALVLTEESFHSVDTDGGAWATVYTLPVHFTIVAPRAGQSPEPRSRGCAP